MKTAYLSKILFIVLAALPVSAQVATNDLFNRPNSLVLGADWVEQDGDAKIVNGKLEANSPFTFGWCSHTAFSASYAGVVVRAAWEINGLGGDSISMIIGLDPVTWNGIEVRIADNNGDGTADRIFFNAAINAGAWFVPGSFANMTTPMVSGEVTMWFSNGGDTVNVALYDPVTLAVQNYSASGILMNPPTGTGVGIGYRGNGRVDDFRAWIGGPTGPSFTLTTIRPTTNFTLLVTEAVPFSPIAVGFSTAGAGPIWTPIGIVGLSDPIGVAFEIPADAAGRLEIVFPPLGALAGVPIHLQGLDIFGIALTNYFTVTI